MSEVVLTKKFHGRNYAYEEVILSQIPIEANKQMQELSVRFKLHYLTMEDCLHRNQRAKVESFGNYQFVVWHYYHPVLEAPIELYIVISAEFLILISDKVPENVAPSWKLICFQKGQSIILNEAICQMFTSLVEHTEHYVHSLKYIMHSLEKKIISKHINPKRMLKIKYLVVELEQSLCPIASVFHHLEKFDFNIEQKFQVRNIEDHNTRILQDITHLRFQSIALMDVYYGSSSARSNLEMRKLTTLSAFLLPMSMWAGFFGMNFDGMPFHEKWFMILGLCLIVGTPISILSFLIYRKYRREKIRLKRKRHDKKIKLHFPFLTRRKDIQKNNFKWGNQHHEDE
ncbi:magnesium transporter CorA family protein [Silvanigrella aquatica]|uniref:Magnesium transporter n=1 Tax=Silvanigrella aquatica TaxID=1915309 RepID=A0A1L4CZS8_9BACT|nr:CorA family divalent cation transporter [Silvanigrella aquatica]APJ03445.1 hypothetical protein AXG55_05805 [Silvanigrella aquatica]